MEYEEKKLAAFCKRENVERPISRRSRKERGRHDIILMKGVFFIDVCLIFLMMMMMKDILYL